MEIVFFCKIALGINKIIQEITVFIAIDKIIDIMIRNLKSLLVKFFIEENFTEYSKISVRNPEIKK